MSSRRPWRNILALLAFFCAVSVAVLPGQDFLHDTPVRIAVVDTEKLVLKSPAGQAGLADLRSLQQSLENVLKQQQQLVTHLRQQVADGRQSGRLESEVIQLQAMADDAERALKTMQEDAARQLTAKRSQILESADAAIMPAVNTFARDNGYTLVLRKFEGGLLYCHDSVDVTEALLQRMGAAE